MRGGLKVDRLAGGSPRFDQLRREWMREPDEVAAMLRLKALGWGVRRIAAEFGCSHVTVRRYLAAGGWMGYRTPRRAKALGGLEEWLAERFRRHAVRPTLSARIWRARRASWSACARSSGQSRRCGRRS